MMSSGICVGAFDSLKWRHIIPCYNELGKIIAAKMIIYLGDKEEYFTFMTVEAYLAVKEWMDFRSTFGEKISRDMGNDRHLANFQYELWYQMGTCNYSIFILYLASTMTCKR